MISMIRLGGRLGSEVEHWDVIPKVRGSIPRVGRIYRVKRMIDISYLSMTLVNPDFLKLSAGFLLNRNCMVKINSTIGFN